MGSTADVPFTIRTHRPGDIGWITHRHGVLYQKEHKWDEQFESMIARITAEFIENFDSTCERCWIAKKEDKFLGCIMLVKDRSSEENAAKLRVLLVEPSASGLGVGSKFVRSCTEFAREVGYARIGLWTQTILTSARRLYANEGYKIIKTEEHTIWGPEMTGELWEKEL